MGKHIPLILRLAVTVVLMSLGSGWQLSAAVGVSSDGARATQAGADYRQGEVLVKYRSAATARMARNPDGAASCRLDALYRQMGISEVRRLDEAVSSGVTVVGDDTRAADGSDGELLHSVSLLRFDTTRVASVEDAVSMLTALDEIELAEPNYLAHIQPVGSARHAVPSGVTAEQWGLEAVNMPALWQMPVVSTKRPVIAIVDTGVDTSHPDLQGNIAGGGYNFVEDSDDVTDHHGHGTHCAGIAAARGQTVFGANPDALILPMVVVDSNGSSTLMDIMLGITRAAGQGADIVSVSLGSYAMSALYHYVINAASKKAIVVAAAGNEGFCMHSTHRDLHGMAEPHLPCLPGAYESAVGVMATREDGRLAPWSNFDCNGPLRGVTQEGYLGWGYQLRVPGNNILSTLPGGDYGFMSGTSMATPLAAGAISRLMQCRQYESREQMLRALIMTTRDHIDVMAAYAATDATLHPGRFTETVDGVECTFVATSDSTVQMGDGTTTAFTDLPSTRLDFAVPDVVRGLAVTALAAQAFKGCGSLARVSLGGNMETIGDQCFAGCSHLQELTFETRFPPSAPATAFDDRHFADVTLRHAQGYAENFKNERPWKSFTNWRDKDLTTGSRFWETIDQQGTRMSFIIYSLDDGYAQVGDGETSIDTLRAGSLVIPKTVHGLSVRIVGNNAFLGCRLMTSVTLSSTVSVIRNQAFSGCESLEAIYVPIATPPTASENVFSNYDKPTLYVPVGCRAQYADAPTWKLFGKIREMAFDGIDDVRLPNRHRSSGRYDLQGRRITDGLPHRGLYLVDGHKCFANGNRQ